MGLGRRWRLLAGALALGLCLLAPAAAIAHGGEASLEMVRPQVGPPLYTHGVDTREEMSSPVAARAASGGIGFTPGSAERDPICSGGYAEQVLYAHIAGSRSRYRRSVEAIRSAVRRMDAVLNSESLASGGPTADYRVRCEGLGAISVGRFTASGTSFAEVVSAARAAGYQSTGSDYLIFFDASIGNACGTASLRDDERLIESNANNTGGGYGLVYADCWNNETPMHEAGHMMGAVQYGAPHSTGTGGHCFQENDVMCYSPDGGDLNQFGSTNDCPGVQRFDCGFDDYFDSAPEPDEYLATHWNLGSPLNHWLAFNAAPEGPDLSGLVTSLLGSGKSSAVSSEAVGVPGEWRYYDLSLSGFARSLTVTVKNAPPGIALYLRSRQNPDASHHACRTAVRGGAAVCRITRPRGGRWVAAVQNVGASAGATFTIGAKIKR
ncbi:MAG: hypothetical protein ACJ75R_08515 [Solirubrobacterales bacterium]